MIPPALLSEEERPELVKRAMLTERQNKPSDVSPSPFPTAWKTKTDNN